MITAPGEGVILARSLTTPNVYLPFVLLLGRPWVQGPAAVKQAWAKMKTMTKETFRD